MTGAHVSPLGVIVLAGGKSSRMRGSDKMSELIGSDTVLNTCVQNISFASPLAPIVVVGPHREPPPPLPVARTVEDPPGGGPVPGVRAGMAAMPDGVEFVGLIAGDMPEAPTLLGELVRPLSVQESLDVAIARTDGSVQPLFAVYRYRRLADVLAGNDTLRTARSLFTELRHRLVELPERLCYDIDTPEDLAAARRSARTRRKR